MYLLVYFQNQKNLQGTVHSVDTASVFRKGGVVEEIPTTHLVPGDIIEIPAHGCVMQCDAVLVNGNCIVNESMLTGKFMLHLWMLLTQYMK